MNRQILELVGVLALAVCVVASGVWIVDVEHHSRQLFIETEDLSRELDKLQIEWGQLQIEQSTLGTHSRDRGARPPALASDGPERQPARRRHRAGALTDETNGENDGG